MTIAYELGQPLTAARNFIAGSPAAAGSQHSSADQQHRLTRGLDGAERQIERAATIIATMRRFVGHLEHVDDVVDLNQVVAECLYFVKVAAGPDRASNAESGL